MENPYGSCRLTSVHRMAQDAAIGVTAEAWRGSVLVPGTKRGVDADHHQDCIAETPVATCQHQRPRNARKRQETPGTGEGGCSSAHSSAMKPHALELPRLPLHPPPPLQPRTRRALVLLRAAHLPCPVLTRALPQTRILLPQTRRDLSLLSHPAGCGRTISSPAGSRTLRPSSTASRGWT